MTRDYLQCKADGCRRWRRVNYAYCERCTRALLRQAFGEAEV